LPPPPPQREPHPPVPHEEPDPEKEHAADLEVDDGDLDDGGDTLNRADDIAEED
jgi:hypothetical protein